MALDTPTIDPRQPTSRDGQSGLTPVIRILHHPDLRRVGEEARPPGLDAGEWVEVGRGRPDFGGGQPLLDPCVSRAVLDLRWVPERGGFEVRVVRGQHVELRTLTGDYCPMGRPLLPGTVVELRERIMLLLTLAPAVRGRTLDMVGESIALWALRADIERIARTRPRTVFVSGATGTGKELAAQALHAAGPRSRAPFVAINCANLDGIAGEDRLFGHVSGAFTDARTPRVGAFVEAGGGTLFFDEIGELSPDMQARLLRVLEERRVAPLGASTSATRAIDVQIIAATHRSLAEDVRAGRFRADLYGRLMEPRVDLPSLADRREDAPLLFAHFLAERAAVVAPCEEIDRCFSPADQRASRIGIGFARALLAHDWPLNVREVVRWAEWAVAWLAGGRRLEAGDRPPGVTALASSPVDDEPDRTLHIATIAKASPVASAPSASSRTTRPARSELRALLEANGYSKSETAYALSISRSTLDRWMAEYGFPAASALGDDVIAAALAAHDGDVAAAAATLEVSERALRLRMNASS